MASFRLLAPLSAIPRHTFSHLSAIFLAALSNVFMAQKPAPALGFSANNQNDICEMLSAPAWGMPRPRPQFPLRKLLH